MLLLYNINMLLYYPALFVAHLQILLNLLHMQRNGHTAHFRQRKWNSLVSAQAQTIQIHQMLPSSSPMNHT